MGSFNFIPWLRLQKPYSVGEIQLIPRHIDKPPKELRPDEVQKVRSILSSYRLATAQPVRHFTAVRFAGHQLLADVDQRQREYMWDSVSLACLSGLSNR
jgi:hypothetical protein